MCVAAGWEKGLGMPGRFSGLRGICTEMGKDTA